MQGALGQSLEIINITHKNVNANREAIAELSQKLYGTQVELNKILINIRAEIDRNFQATTLVERVQALFQVVASTLGITLHQLAMLKTELELARQGNLAATLVPIAQFRSILMEIKSDLPRGTYLPTEVEDIGWYYASLPMISFRTARK